MDRHSHRARGRNRIVSRAAKARRASEERYAKAHAPPRAPTPPPITPLNDPMMNSLEDQLHMAYCLDQFDLCKVIYLKIKGIQVTGDDDPRLAAVKPEDFDEYFMPNGPLMTEEEERERLGQLQEQDRQHVEQMQQALVAEGEHLRQTVWENNTANRWQSGQKKFKVAKIRSWKLKEDEIRIQDESCERGRPVVPHVPPPRLSYDSLIPTKPDPLALSTLRPTATMQIPRHRRSHLNRQHQSTSRTPTTSGLASSLHTSQPSSSRATSSQSSPSSSRPDFAVVDTIPFPNVVKSMRGQLFPLDASERRCSSNATAQSQPRRKADELLDVLFQPVECQDGDRFQRSLKGKQREVPVLRSAPRSSENLCAACKASSKTFAPPSRSSTSSTISSMASTSSATDSSDSGRGHSFFSSSRRGSWLSFGSHNSYNTTSTALTTPSTSPSIGSWFKSPSFIPPVLPHVPKSSSSSYRCTCQRPFSRPTRISANEGPLSLDSARERRNKQASLAGLSSGAEPRRSGARSDSWSAHMANLIALAKGFQAAYVGAVVFSTVPTLSNDWDSASPRDRQRVGKSGQQQMKLEKPGFRARSYEVAVFLGEPALEVEVNDSRKPIPLLSPFPQVLPPSTILPSALPYEKKFKQGIPPTPSPMKRFAQRAIAQQQGRGDDYEFASPARRSASPARSLHKRSSSLSSTSSELSEKAPKPVARARYIPNPVFLRIRALQNIIGSEGLVWEGYSQHDNTYGRGKERLVGMAFEFLPRSGLCVEDHVRVYEQTVKEKTRVPRYGRDMGVFNVRAR